MGGKSSPPPPDYSGMEALGREQLQFARDQYADIKPLAQQIAAQQMAAQQQQMTQAQDYYNYQKDTFRPVEQGLVRDAQNFSTEGYREQMAGQAAAAAGRAFGVQQEMGQRGPWPLVVSIQTLVLLWHCRLRVIWVLPHNAPTP